jgi:hypothetical protein
LEFTARRSSFRQLNNQSSINAWDAPGKVLSRKS